MYRNCFSVLTVFLIVTVLFLLSSLVYCQGIEKLKNSTIVLVPIYKITEISNTYMAKFIGDKYVWVCESHCDTRSTTEIYVYQGKKACLYRLGGTSAVELVKCENGKSPNTWFFPGCTFQDVLEVGTNALINGKPLWKILGFNDTTSGHFYGQGCYGKIGAVGDIYRGALYIFDVDTGKVIVNETGLPTGDDGVRRLKVIKIGDYIVVLASACGTPELWIYFIDPVTDTLVKKITVSLQGSKGLHAIDVDNHVNPMFIVGGGAGDGYVYVWNATPLKKLEPPKLIYVGAPGGSTHFYNPFYDFHYYRTINVFVFKSNPDWSPNTDVAVVYDPWTNKTYVLKGLGGRAGSVSPSGKWAVIGQWIYYVIRVPAGVPIIEVEGDVEVPSEGNLTQILSQFINASTNQYKLLVRGFEFNVTKAIGVSYRVWGSLSYKYTKFVIGWGEIETPSISSIEKPISKVGVIPQKIYAIKFSKYFFIPKGVKDTAITLIPIYQKFVEPIRMEYVDYFEKYPQLLPSPPHVDIVLPPVIDWKPGLTYVYFKTVIPLAQLVGEVKEWLSKVTGAEVEKEITKSIGYVRVKVKLNSREALMFIKLIDNYDKIRLREIEFVPSPSLKVIKLGDFGIPEDSWRYLKTLPEGVPKVFAPLWETTLKSVLVSELHDFTLTHCVLSEVTLSECKSKWFTLLRNKNYLDAVREFALDIFKWWLSELKEAKYKELLLKAIEKGFDIVVAVDVIFKTSFFKHKYLLPPEQWAKVTKEFFRASRFSKILTLGRAGWITLAILGSVIAFDFATHPFWFEDKQTVFWNITEIPFYVYKTRNNKTIACIHDQALYNIMNLKAYSVKGMTIDDYNTIVKKILKVVKDLTNVDEAYVCTFLYPVVLDGKFYGYAVSNLTRTYPHNYVQTIYIDELIGVGNVITSLCTVTQDLISSIVNLIGKSLKFDMSFRVIPHISLTYVKYREITDPEKLAEILESELRAIYGNLTLNITCQPMENYARCYLFFTVPLEVFGLQGLRHFLTSAKTIAHLVLARPCENITINGKGFGWLCGFHFIPPKKIEALTFFRIENVRLRNIPTPVILIERKWWRLIPENRSEWDIAWINESYKHIILDILYKNSTAVQVYKRNGSMFDINKTYTLDSKKFVIFETITKTKAVYLDPTNGGMLQPCKWYYFYVWNALPPDVGITGIYINGTFSYATFPHELQLELYSTVEQDVIIGIKIYGIAEINNTQYVYKKYDPIYVKVHVYANRFTKSQRIEVGKIMSELQRIAWMLFGNKTFAVYAYVEAFIKDAKFNYLGGNDRVVTTIQIPPAPVQPAILIVKVYDIETGKPIPNALVEVYEIPGFRKIASDVTNESGYVIFNVYMWRKYRIRAEASGYRSTFVDVYVDQLIFFVNVPLSKEYTIPPGTAPTPPELSNATTTLWSVTVDVFYEDGTPFQGAYVLITNATDNSTITDGYTDSTGRFVTYVENDTWINVYVVASIDHETYRFVNESIHVISSIYLYYVVPVYANITIGESAILNIWARDPVNNVYVTDLCVIVYNETTTIAKGCTNKTGVFSVHGLKTGQEVDVNVTKVPKGYYVTQTHYVIKIQFKVTNFTIYVYPVSVTPPNATVYVYVHWNNTEPCTGAIVEVYNATTMELMFNGTTNSYGEYIFEVPFNSSINVHVKVKINETYTWEDWHNNTVINETPYTIEFIIPMLPPTPPPKGNYVTLFVYVWDVWNRTWIPNAIVYVWKIEGEELKLWGRCITNNSGVCNVTVVTNSYYGINASHPKYVMLLPKGWTYVLTYIPWNVTTWNVTINMIPKGMKLLPSIGNKTEPRVMIDTTVYNPLNVEVRYSDGVGFKDAFVNITDLTHSKVLFTGYTDSDGKVPTVYILNGSEVQVFVNATEENRTYTETRRFVITEDLWLIFIVPWKSKYFTPEVGIVNLRIVPHLGIGQYMGKPVKHMYEIEFFTNTPQTIVVNYTLYKIVNNKYIKIMSWNKTYELKVNPKSGTNILYFRHWFEINVSEPTWIILRAEIVKYENDTDPRNNILWSNKVLLRPLIEMYINLTYKVVKRKYPDISLDDPRLFPGDVIEVKVFVKTERKVKLFNIPVKLRFKSISKVLRHKIFDTRLNKTMYNQSEIMFKFYVVIPWDQELVLTANFTSPVDNYLINNNITITLPIALDAYVTRVEVPKFVLANSKFKVKVYYMTNAWELPHVITIEVGGLSTEIEDIPKTGIISKVVEVEVTAPSVPGYLFWIIPKPTETYDMNITLTTTDDYPKNNVVTTSIVVISTSWAWAGVIIGTIFVIGLILWIVSKLTKVSTRVSRRKMFKIIETVSKEKRRKMFKLEE